MHLSNSRKNILNITASHSSNIVAYDNFKNIKISNGSGSNIAANNDSIISDPLIRRVSQQREVDLVRDPMTKLISNSNGELPADVTGVSETEETAEAFLVSDNQNININNGISSNILPNLILI